MEHSTSIATLAASLVNFRGQVKSIKKDGVNPFFRSKYASLDQIWETIRKPLTDNGLTVIQLPSGDNELTTVILHTSGEFISATSKINTVEPTPQSQGSAITYMRRYALAAALGLTADEDDDGNVATTAAKAFTVSPTALRKTCSSCQKEYNPKPGTEHFSTVCTNCYKAKMTKPKLNVIAPDLSDPQDEEMPPF